MISHILVRVDNVQSKSVLNNNAVYPVKYVRVDILLTCGEHLHDRIILIRGEVWNYNWS